MMRNVAFALFAFAMSAPAMADEPKDSGPDPRIGKKVNRICFQRSIDNWRPVQGTDNAVLLERGVNDWYYVTLAGACRESIFRSAIAIGLETRPGGGCVTNGDVILVRDAPGFTQRCVITRINKWDHKAAARDDSGAARD